MEAARLVLAILILGLIFAGLGLLRARRRDRLIRDGRIDHGFVTKLIVTSLGLSVSLITVAYPAGFVLGSLSMADPSIPHRLEDHLPAGFGVQFILGVMALGVLVTVAYALYSYADHVNSG